MTSSIDHLYKPIKELTNIFFDTPIPSQEEWLQWSQEKREEHDAEIRDQMWNDTIFDSHVHSWMNVCVFAKSPTDNPEYIRKRASVVHPMHNACTISDIGIYLSNRIPRELSKYQIGKASDQYKSDKIRRQYNFLSKAVVTLGGSEYPISIYSTENDGMTRVSFTINNWRSHKHEDTYTIYYYVVPRDELIPIYKRARLAHEKREKLLDESR
ncbi:hypothetical protein [Psychromonas sp. Urea-02u-13]|uniref:hypothetical protein n=1 Tax=Psychromonas sp. Urea-02u-13 TaxID=2058326 RepID=UPI000C326E99|nr:hypothetical protein [Psychromonas sp. Urea-02u-13]PKG38005.1 hypothetical protein CXF74_15975 [Psychromonas sp. Urea-02u-13]